MSKITVDTGNLRETITVQITMGAKGSPPPKSPRATKVEAKVDKLQDAMAKLVKLSKKDSLFRDKSGAIFTRNSVEPYVG